MERVDPAAEDGLGSLLRDVNVRSVVYCLSEFAAPWGFSVERSPVAKFHVILNGFATLAVGDAAPMPLTTGDLVLLPHGDGHTISDQPGLPVRQLDAILAGKSKTAKTRRKRTRKIGPEAQSASP